MLAPPQPASVLLTGLGTMLAHLGAMLAHLQAMYYGSHVGPDRARFEAMLGHVDPFGCIRSKHGKATWKLLDACTDGGERGEVSGRPVGSWALGRIVPPAPKNIKNKRGLARGRGKCGNIPSNIANSQGFA